ncbi:MAG: BamA/TamA family outer membrane protein [Ignavibacteria bacterium]
MKLANENPYYLDSLNLIVKDLVVSGNEITKDEIILREMTLKKGSKFRLEKYTNDILRIYNLGLFTKVDIIPVPVSGKDIMLNVDVQERWYIFPLPQAGIEDGEWAKKWVGMNIVWENFRGRNETALLSFKILYNPFIKISYSVPWIGEKIHLFSTISGSYSKTRNKSLAAIGKSSGNETIKEDEKNYDNYQFKSQLTTGKFLSRRFAVFSDLGYDYIRVSEYASGRTLSPTGKDKYLKLGLGFQYDSRNILEFATKGYFLKTSYLRYGFLDELINFGRFDFESQNFIPIHLKKNYFITIASKLYTSLSVGAVIPVYNHEYLGYSEDFVRGWKGIAFEGENVLTLYDEIRIPIIQPQYIKAKNIALVRDMPILKRLDLKYGLFFTIIYDVGTVWNKNDNIFKVKFLNGTGIGLNAILPFGYIFRTEWTFRLGKPTVGQFGISLSAKF